MNVPSSMLLAMYEAFDELDIGYLKIFCDESDRKNAANCFTSAYGEGEVTQGPDGFEVSFSCLDFDNYDEDYGFTSVRFVPVDQALHAVEQKYPNIRYQGVTCYAFRTIQDGDMGWNEYIRGVSDDTLYEPIGNALSDALEEDAFWMFLLEETDLTDTEVREIEEFCMAYADYLSEESLEKLNSFSAGMW